MLINKTTTATERATLSGLAQVVQRIARIRADPLPYGSRGYGHFQDHGRALSRTRGHGALTGEHLRHGQLANIPNA